MTLHCSLLSQQLLYFFMAVSIALLFCLFFGSSSPVYATPATSRGPLFAIGLLNTRIVAIFKSGDQISDDQSSIDQMIVYDLATSAFTPVAKTPIVLLSGDLQLLFKVWPALSSALQKQQSKGLPKGFLMTISDEDLQEYLFVGVSGNTKNVLFNLQTKKVVSVESFSVADCTQLVTSKSPKTFYDFKFRGNGVYSYTKYTVQGAMVSKADTSLNKDSSSSMCILKSKDSTSYVVKDGSKDCSEPSSSPVEWQLSGGGFSDGTHFHLFTEEQVMIVPMNYPNDTDTDLPVRVISIEDYFEKATWFHRGLAFIIEHYIYAIIIIGLIIFVLFISLVTCMWCCKKGEENMAEVHFGSHDHRKSDSHRHNHSGATAVPSPQTRNSKSQPQKHSHPTHTKPNPNAVIARAAEKMKSTGKRPRTATPLLKSAPRVATPLLKSAPKKSFVLGTSALHHSSAAAISMRSTSVIGRVKVSKSKLKPRGKPKSRNKTLTLKPSSSSLIVGVSASKVRKNRRSLKKKHSRGHSKRGRSSKKRRGSSSSSSKNSSLKKRHRRHSGHRHRADQKVEANNATLVNFKQMSSHTAIHRPVKKE